MSVEGSEIPDGSAVMGAPGELQPPVGMMSSESVGMGSAQPFHSASLYVGELAPEVNEGLLFEVFNAVGPVSSIRVCRDAVTRRSLGYAYINFHQIGDAERALDTMNYTMIGSRPCRIMWSQRDPSLRRSGVGNIFVKNLHESIDNKQLYDTFSLFGNILSCKVVTDRQNGDSKGYGYVHYETQEAADAAIDKLDGMLIDGQEVQVGAFMRRQERPGTADWTNCYVKGIPFHWDDARLHQEFCRFGEVLSAAITMGVPKMGKKTLRNTEDGDKDSDSDSEDNEEYSNDENQKSTGNMSEGVNHQEKDVGESKLQNLGFGFVNFVDHESAAMACDELNGKEYETVVDGNTVMQEMYVGRAQKKSERERELRAKFEAQKMDRISKFQGVNLYVKNLDDSVTDEMLRDEFSGVGTITSARVMRDAKDGQSRGFGFVCYSAPEEAARAVNEMNGKLLANKPVFVALAQRREVRRAQLEAQHNQRGLGGPGQQPMMRGAPMTSMGYPGVMPMYMQRPGPGGSMQPAYPMMPHMMGVSGRGAPQQPQGAYPMIQQQPPLQQARGTYPMPTYSSMQPQSVRGGRVPVQAARGGGRGNGRGPSSLMQQGRGGPVLGRGVQPGIKFNQHARNSGGPMPTNHPMPPTSHQQQAPGQNSGPLPPAAHEILTAAALASATPELQKNMIGERLYPLIHHSQPELAGKITGMLLEMDNSELLHLLESPEALNSKISEALQVLEAHNQSAVGSE